MVQLQSADSGSYDQIISIKYDCKKLLGLYWGHEAPMVIIHLVSKNTIWWAIFSSAEEHVIEVNSLK